MNQNENKYATRKNILKIGNDEIIFKYNINDILEVNNMLIVRIESPRGVVFNENVFGVSLAEKKIEWQIVKLQYGTESDCPFVGIKFYDGQLYLNNWCDIHLIVDPITGEVLERSLPSKS